MDTQTVFKVAFMIFILHLIYKNYSYNTGTETFGLSLASTKNTELAQTTLEKHIEHAANKDFQSDIDNSRFEVAPALSGAPSFDDLQFNNIPNGPVNYPLGLTTNVFGEKLHVEPKGIEKGFFSAIKPKKHCKIDNIVYQQHADSNLTLANVLLNQSNETIQPENTLGDTFVSAQFGDTSLIPTKNNFGLKKNINFPSTAILSGSLNKNALSNRINEPGLGFAKLRNSGQPNIQIDSKFYKNSQYDCGGVMGELMAANNYDNYSSV